MESKPLVRLSKIMAERGICSRREADELIAAGQVYVDGLRVKELGIKVPPDCSIELSEAAKEDLASQVTVLLNKPIGYVSAQPEKDYEPAIVLLTAENYDGDPRTLDTEPRKLTGLAVAGRLDIDSQGLLIFTQDGTIAKQLIGENTEVEKEYLVRVDGHLNQHDLNLLRFGLELDGQKLKPAAVDWANEDQLRFVLKEGKKRQVRRMCEAVGLRVLGLKRVRVGEVRLGKLPEGKWRYLDKGESFIKTTFRKQPADRRSTPQSPRRGGPPETSKPSPSRFQERKSRLR
jgi:23S rRNA pseudouridine2604 synthase